MSINFLSIPYQSTSESFMVWSPAPTDRDKTTLDTMSQSRDLMETIYSNLLTGHRVYVELSERRSEIDDHIRSEESRGEDMIYPFGRTDGPTTYIRFRYVVPTLYNRISSVFRRSGGVGIVRRYRLTGFEDIRTMTINYLDAEIVTIESREETFV
ncbi:hypothetical protein TREMEDRAFT_59626 [Tremella mesenterica DSM 1558]|uniref:uncharacterized protein n=1 Tax=Tremella mesenterica (strain ATCC 24925 / CBS 8224 / DSM 1558 / NBRC 9311 / NRRL Y-6157 / RJB 2259-6 / UBC 559-6) TaxID=578456 RepID=UPI0003F4984C|nr:uncharacterized protein TREMEDRAFT_59626 [Tremella mesenterica DSM 1558]EIW73458.1 hypothetical protein TREMEDRAFT_59626 [Tremella mesenterica DSM 1558]